MTHFHTVIDIEASPDRVWAVLWEVERWPEWTPTVKSVVRVDPGALAIGSRVRIRQPKLLPAEWLITELTSGRSFTWVTSSPGLRVSATHEVEPNAGGSRVTLTLEFSGLLAPLVARLTRGLNERYLGLEARGLRDRSEGAPAIPSRRPGL